MTKKEKEIYDLICKNPTISQVDIATKLNLSKSCVAVHISNLIKKGYILGKKYILKQDPKMLVIGACNIDIQGISSKKINPADSNIGKVHFGFGGVGRNIFMNLRNLVPSTRFISLVSKDYFGSRLIDDLNKRSVNTKDLILTDNRSSIYLSILDSNRDLNVAISDMDLITHLTPDLLETKKDLIEESQIIVIDTNLSKDSLNYLVKLKKKNQIYVTDTVSVEKARRISDIISCFDIVKTNRLELEALCNEKARTLRDIKLLGEKLIKKGVKKLFVTLGPKGLVCFDQKNTFVIKNPKNVVVNDVTGAGDMFTSAISYCEKHNLSLRKSAMVAQCASLYKISKLGTVPDEFSEEILEKEYIKYYGGVK